MNNLKKFTIAICLILTLSGATFAGEVNAPPCTTDPGEVNAPPCSSTQQEADDSGTQTGPAMSSELDTLTIATISAIESLLTVY
ncbi:MAG: hypothetical protein ABR607_05105 [Pyrinomonadaceae bacterium]